MSTPELSWLLDHPEWNQALQAVQVANKPEAWNRLVQLANTRLDMMKTVRLDRQLTKSFKDGWPSALQTKLVRLAVLGSSTVDHLFPGMRIGALRRNIALTVYRSNYGQYTQEVYDTSSPLYAWEPDTVLFAFDSRHLLGSYQVGESSETTERRIDETIERIVQLWRTVRDRLGCQIIQQSAMPIYPRLFGENESRLPGSPAVLIESFNARLRAVAADEGVSMLSVDRWVAEDGLSAWHDPIFWYRAKQEIHPAAMPMYGDIVGRTLAALQGKSFKCLVLDLDNTLWGGVIGDDGLDGILLGQGNALGEAFSNFQKYAKDLAQRGIILAVCSKNEEKNALLPFEQHPEMVLKREDIACFAASWGDKATAIRSISRQLNIGLEAIVFADDNPFERNIIRRELPMVAVPELPLDPALFPAMISRAGYFEGTRLTADDMIRTKQYRENSAREAMRETATDMQSYLSSLDMKLYWSRFKHVDQDRVVQLINKTNQFNLTTRRYASNEVAALIRDPDVLSLQMRLSDRFGDNGIISIIIGYPVGEDSIDIDTWLMSCRVLGRQVEDAAFGLVVAEARRMGMKRLVGRYRPTEKNGLVAGHYQRLGFSVLPGQRDDVQEFELHLDSFVQTPDFIQVVEN